MTITHDFVAIDNCDDVSKWTPVGDGAVSLNTSNYIEGSGAINIYKPNTNQTNFGAERTLDNAIDMENTVFAMWLYIRDPKTLEKITSVKIYFIDTSGNYGYIDVYNGYSYGDIVFTEPLSAGWNKIRFLVPITTRYSGGNFLPPWTGKSDTSPDINNIIKIRIEIEAVSASTTVEEGEIVIDYLVYGKKIVVGGGTEANPMTFEKFWDEWDKKIPVVDRIDGDFPNYRFYVSVQFIDYIDLEDAVLDLITMQVDYNMNPATIFANEYTVGTIRNVKFILHAGSSWWRGGPFKIVNSKVNIERCVFEMLCGGKEGDGYCQTIGIYLPEGYYIKDSLIEGYSNGHCSVDMTDMPGDIINVLFKNVRLVTSRYSTKKYVVHLSNVNYTVGYGGNTYTLESIVMGNIYFSPLGQPNHWYFYDPDLRTEITPNNFGNGAILDIYYSIKAQFKDMADNPIANATVNIYDDSGNLIGSTTTDSEGWMIDKIYFLRRECGKDVNGNPIDKLHKIKIEVVKGNTIYYSAWLDINSKFEGTIKVYNAYIVTAYPDKPSVQINEPVTITAEFKDWSGTPLTGLSVTAEITKPDGTTKETITLEEVQSGIYSGTFRDTDQVGDYDVKVSTTIDNNNVSTKTKFSVGRIESLINKVLNWMKRGAA